MLGFQKIFNILVIRVSAWDVFKSSSPSTKEHTGMSNPIDQPLRLSETLLIPELNPSHRWQPFVEGNLGNRCTEGWHRSLQCLHAPLATYHMPLLTPHCTCPLPVTCHTCYSSPNTCCLPLASCHLILAVRHLLRICGVDVWMYEYICE